MKAVNAKEFDMVAAWSVDRLGRSLTDLLGILQELQEKGRPVPSSARYRYVNHRRQGDVSDVRCIAEFEREIIRIGTSVVQRVFKQEPRPS